MRARGSTATAASSAATTDCAHGSRRACSGGRPGGGGARRGDTGRGRALAPRTALPRGAASRAVVSHLYLCVFSGGSRRRQLCADGPRSTRLVYWCCTACALQVNTPGAESLCNLLRDLCQVGPSTTLLDVCCGTGTLGLSLVRTFVRLARSCSSRGPFVTAACSIRVQASSVRRVIGIEICAPAVEDARANAERNGVANTTFIAAKAEVATRKLLDGLSPEERDSLVAIVDPPRAGLHPEVLKA